MRACSVTDLVRLVRAGNLLVAAAGVIAGGLVALGAIAVPRLLGFAALAAVGFGAAGNALNDLRDVAADQVNRPGGERPVAAGRLRRETAHLVVAAGIFIGVAMAALVSGTALLVGIAALVVIAAYSPLLKPAGFAGNVAIAAIAGLPLWYGALAVGRPAAGVVPWHRSSIRHAVGCMAYSWARASHPTRNLCLWPGERWSWPPRIRLGPRSCATWRRMSFAGWAARSAPEW